MRSKWIVIAGAVLAGAVLTGCGNGSGAPSSGGRGPAIPEPRPGLSGGSAGQRPEVGPEQAGRIATDRFGGQVINVEPDHARGAPSWEVEVRDSSQGRIEVDVSRGTGEIVELERDSGD
ncbi:PepSY domain-containing protein [Saccharopolyspora rosea]|uniref:PepSY domain-containing protein n=1 Tax=Saccharopolyspora rosea TaxID=524884 RepID=A0ABW3G0T8_9PSEU|nr:PepSY domain-containing protein [Saccharopolyspora rosea]